MWKRAWSMIARSLRSVMGGRQRQPEELGRILYHAAHLGPAGDTQTSNQELLDALELDEADLPQTYWLECLMFFISCAEVALSSSNQGRQEATYRRTMDTVLSEFHLHMGEIGFEEQVVQGLDAICKQRIGEYSLAWKSDGGAGPLAVVGGLVCSRLRAQESRSLRSSLQAGALAMTFVRRLSLQLQGL